LYFELRGAFFLFLAEKFLILLQRDSVWQETFCVASWQEATGTRASPSPQAVTNLTSYQ
jgi:hypothetical protein